MPNTPNLDENAQVKRIIDEGSAEAAASSSWEKKMRNSGRVPQKRPENWIM